MSLLKPKCRCTNNSGCARAIGEGKTHEIFDFSRRLVLLLPSIFIIWLFYDVSLTFRMHFDIENMHTLNVMYTSSSLLIVCKYKHSFKKEGVLLWRLFYATKFPITIATPILRVIFRFVFKLVVTLCVYLIWVSKYMQTLYARHK